MDVRSLPHSTVRVSPVLTDEQTRSLIGGFLSEDSFDTIVRENTDIFCEATGDCLLKFRRNVVPRQVVETSFEALKGAAAETDNRGYAAGIMTDEDLAELKERLGAANVERQGDGVRAKITWQDGRVATRTRAKFVNSGIIGFMGRSQQHPFCRQTAFTQKNWDEFAKAYPIIKLVDTVYEQLMPEPYALQRALADRTSPDFVIKNTSFTTVTVNRNWQTACHTDAGDFKQGFGNLVALRKGRYTGGYFVLPQYRIAVDMQNCDVLLVDVHRVHGNTPITKVDADATRLSLVMYYREDIAACGTNTEELDRARGVMQGRMSK